MNKAENMRVKGLLGIWKEWDEPENGKSVKLCLWINKFSTSYSRDESKKNFIFIQLFPLNRRFVCMIISQNFSFLSPPATNKDPQQTKLFIFIASSSLEKKLLKNDIMENHNGDWGRGEGNKAVISFP